MNESVEKFCRLRRIVGPGDVSAIASTPSAVPQPPPPTKLDVQGEGALTHPIPSPKLQEASVVTLNLALKPCPEVSPSFQKLTRALSSPASLADHPRFPRITTRAPALTIHPAGICGGGRPRKGDQSEAHLYLGWSGRLAALKEGHVSD